jgi:hypothetical protein
MKFGPNKRIDNYSFFILLSAKIDGTKKTKVIFIITIANIKAKQVTTIGLQDKCGFLELR